MIHSITLNNYMSHKAATFELHPGMNAIIGESRAGKSTVIRALDLTRRNAIPLRHISRWARKRNKKGDMVLTDRMSVAIATSKGTVERFRDAKENGYTVNGKKLVAVGTDVPAEVSEVLNLTDVNFALQHDPHFFLSWTPGAISRYLNDICGMEVIDRATAIAIRLRNATRAEVDKAAMEAETHAKAAEALQWVEKAGELLEAAQEATHCMEQANLSASRLGGIMQEAAKAATTVENTRWAALARVAHSRALEGAEQARAKWIKFGALAGLVQAAEEAKEALARSARFALAREVLGKAKESAAEADEAFSLSTRVGDKVAQAGVQLAILARTALFSEAETLLKDAKTAFQQANGAKSDAKGLQEVIFSALSAQKVLMDVNKWPKSREVLEGAKKASKRAEMAHADAVAVGTLVRDLVAYDNAVIVTAKNLGLLKLQREETLAKMPKICPTCGQAIHNCTLAV